MTLERSKDNFYTRIRRIVYKFKSNRNKIDEWPVESVNNLEGNSEVNFRDVTGKSLQQIINPYKFD